VTRILQPNLSSNSRPINLFPSSALSSAQSVSLRYPLPLHLSSLECSLPKRDAVSPLDSALTKNCRVSYPRPSFFYSLPYTLPSCVWFKSFVCHSYENCRGVHQFFPFRNRASDEDASPACSERSRRERAPRSEGSLLHSSLVHSALRGATHHSLLLPLSFTSHESPITSHRFPRIGLQCPCTKFRPFSYARPLRRSHELRTP